MADTTEGETVPSPNSETKKPKEADKTDDNAKKTEDQNKMVNGGTTPPDNVAKQQSPDRRQTEPAPASPEPDWGTPEPVSDLQDDVDIEEHERTLKENTSKQSNVRSQRSRGQEVGVSKKTLPSIGEDKGKATDKLSARGQPGSPRKGLYKGSPNKLNNGKVSEEKLPDVWRPSPDTKSKKSKRTQDGVVSPPEPFSSTLVLPHGRVPASKQQSTLFKSVKGTPKISPRALDSYEKKLPSLSGKPEFSSPSPRATWRSKETEEEPPTTRQTITTTIQKDKGKTKAVVRKTKPKLSRSEANFVRLAKIVSKVGSDLLRLAFTNYLERQHPPRKVHQFLASNKRRLKSYASSHKLLMRRWDVMYPNDDETRCSLQRLDAAIVFWFLRFICHLKRPNDFIWKRKPANDDLTETGDIARIRDDRNFLINISSPALYDDEYDRKVDELKRISLRLGGDKMGEEYCKIIEEMRVAPVRHSERAQYLSILNQWANETGDQIIGEYEEAPAKAGGGIITERKEMTQKFLERYRNPKVFVRTKVFQKARGRLMSGGSVVLRGNTGDGKTTMAIALMVSEFDEDECSLITSPSQWGYVDQKSVSAILIDDIFGSGSLDENLLYAWEEKFEEIYETATDTRERVGVKVIITIRQHILDQCHSHLKKYRLFQDARIINIASAEASFQEKKTMFGRHLMASGKTLAKSEIDKSAKIHTSRLGFPQCCALYANEEHLFVLGAPFFERPIEYLLLTLDRMYEGDKYSYLAMVIMMFQKDGILFIQRLLDNLDTEFRSKLLDLAVLCQVLPNEEVRAFVLDSLPFMVGSFVNYYEDRECYTFSHESVMEAMMASFGEKHPQEVLEGCSLPFLMDYVGTDVSFEDRGEIFIMRVAEKNFEVLAKVLQHFILSGEVKRVSQHRAMKDERFVSYFFEYMDRNHSTVEVIMSEDNNFRESLDSTRKVGFLYGAIDQEVPNAELVNHILKTGAFKQKSKEKWCEQELLSSLEMSIKKGSYEIYSILAEFGITPPDRVLYVESYFVSADIIRDVLQRRHWSQEQIDIALVRASRGARQQTTEIVSILLEHSAAINSVRVGTTPLCEAVKSGKMKTVMLLMTSGASVDDRDGTQQTPLHHACDWNNIEAVKVFLKKNANVNARDALGFTPYLVAAGWGREAVMEQLLTKRVDCLAADDQENTVLHICAANGQTKIMKMLIDRFPSEMKSILILRNRHGWTPLDFALRCGHLGVTKLLIYAILKYHALKTNGRTFVHTRFYVVKLEDFDITERYKYRFLDAEAGRTCFQMPRGNWFIQAGSREEYEQVRLFSIKFESKLRQCLAKS